jgi:signal transduction histidine kinase
LRLQLAFWNATVILVLVLATFVGLRLGLTWALHRELDAQLGEDLDEVVLILARFGADWRTIKEELDRKAVSHKAHDWFARVFDGNGRLLVETVGAPTLLSPPGMTATTLSTNGYRVLQRRDGLADKRQVIRVGCSLEAVTEDVDNLTRILVFAACIFLIVAPVTGWLLAGRATHPIASIVHTAARTQPGHLKERVPLRGTGDELDQLAATLNSLLDRLAAHVDQQRAFVANAAHELRSPLAALRASAEGALSQERSAEEYRERLADVVEASDRLVMLVNQLLLLAEGQSGPIRAATPVALDRLAARMVDMFAGVAEQRDVQLVQETAEPVWVPGSETHLGPVISNLIDNALKFTAPGGTVTIRVRPLEDRSFSSAHRQDSPQALLEVQDTGQGIAPEDLPHIFERFYRADPARRRAGGSGLGLSICQALVASHGGEIHLTSEPGKGTTATVLLPAYPRDSLPNLTKM